MVLEDYDVLEDDHVKLQWDWRVSNDLSSCMPKLS